MAETPKRLCGPLNFSQTNTTLYTVPASTVAIIRNIHVMCNTAGWFSLAINFAATSGSSCIYYQYQLPIQTAFDWSGFLVLAAGDTLQGITSSTGMALTVSGIEVN